MIYKTIYKFRTNFLKNLCLPLLAFKELGPLIPCDTKLCISPVMVVAEIPASKPKNLHIVSRHLKTRSPEYLKINKEQKISVKKVYKFYFSAGSDTESNTKIGEVFIMRGTTTTKLTPRKIKSRTLQ